MRKYKHVHIIYTVYTSVLSTRLFQSPGTVEYDDHITSITF